MLLFKVTISKSGSLPLIKNPGIKIGKYYSSYLFFFGIYTLKYVGTAAEKLVVKTADIKSGFPVSFQVNQEFHANWIGLKEDNSWGWGADS